MWRTPRLVPVLLVMLGPILFPRGADACSFVRLPIENHLQSSSAVFVGEVTAVKHNVNQTQTPQGLLVGPGTIELTFKISRVVKGNLKVGDSIVVSTSDQSSACGITEWARQPVGASWVVYAYHNGSMFQTGISQPTKTTPSADEDLKYFDSLK